ncbi:hypothetical protein EBZ39_12650 [bacterium]|nr:hypothetical protein [bacterium]
MKAIHPPPSQIGVEYLGDSSERWAGQCIQIVKDNGGNLLTKTRKQVDALKLMAERDDARLGEYCLR